jgi:hypothetical protein
VVGKALRWRVPGRRVLGRRVLGRRVLDRRGMLCARPLAWRRAWLVAEMVIWWWVAIWGMAACGGLLIMEIFGCGMRMR